MNDKQKSVLVVGIIILVLATLYPPWVLRDTFVGWRPLFFMPGGNDVARLAIDYGRLIAYWVVIGGITAAAYIFYKNT